MTDNRIPQETVDKLRHLDLIELARRYGFTGQSGNRGGEAIGPCPGCGGTDRFGINTNDNVWCCRQGGGDPIGGDAIAMVQHFENCSFLRAVEILGGDLSDIKPRDTAKTKKQTNEFREKERKRAYDLWRTGRPFIDGGFVADYLRIRGLDPDLARMPGAHCREAVKLPFWQLVEKVNPVDGATEKEWQVIHKGPAMLWPITGMDGHFLGLHATWIDLDQPKGKAEIFCRNTGEQLPAKKVRGSLKGGRIILRHIPDSPNAAAGEGIETVLAWALMKGADETLYSTITLGNLAGRAVRGVSHPTEKITRRDGRKYPVRFPGPDPRLDDDQSKLFAPDPHVKRLINLGDRDSERYATHAAMTRAATRLTSDALTVETDWPLPGHDFDSHHLQLTAREHHAA